MDEPVLDEIKFPTDTLIHVRGMPFELKAGTPVYGRAENAKLIEPTFDNAESKGIS